MGGARLAREPVAGGVLRFGAPLALGMILHGGFNLVDMVMVGRLPEGSSALAALGLCDMLAALATIVSQGVSTASVALVSRRHGAGEGEAVRRLVWQSLIWVACLSLLVGIFGILGSDVIVRRAMGAKGDVAQLAGAYLAVMLGGSYSIFLLLQVTALLRALGHAKSAAALLVGGNALNLLLDVFFVFGPGDAPSPFGFGPPIAAALGIPRLGVVGAAWATLIGRTVPVLIGLWWLTRPSLNLGFRRDYLALRLADLRALVRVAWPSSLELALRVGAVLAFLALVASCFTTPEDPSVLAAYAICLRLEVMVLFVGLGWGAAASSYVGTNLGAREPGRAKASGYWAAVFGGLSAAGMTWLFVFYADPVFAFFDATEAVRATGVEYLHLVAPTYVPLAVAVVFSQAMAGAGATRESLLLDAGVLWLVVVPVSVVAVRFFAVDATWLFAWLAVGNVLGALAFVVAYVRGGFLHAGA